MMESPDRGGPAFRVEIAIFPLLVLVQCAFFYVLPFLVPFLTGIALVTYGIGVSYVAMRDLAQWRTRIQLWAIVLVAATWSFWVYVPTKEAAIHVRFWIERHNYERAVAEISRGAKPGCLATDDCMFDGRELVFPYPGLLSAWIGIVYVPDPDNGPDLALLKSVAGVAGCDPEPISGHYYMCGFY